MLYMFYTWTWIISMTNKYIIDSLIINDQQRLRHANRFDVQAHLSYMCSSLERTSTTGDSPNKFVPPSRSLLICSPVSTSQRRPSLLSPVTMQRCPSKRRYLVVSSSTQSPIPMAPKSQRTIRNNHWCHESYESCGAPCFKSWLYMALEKVCLGRLKNWESNQSSTEPRLLHAGKLGINTNWKPLN